MELIDTIEQYVADHICEFHTSRLKKLESLNLMTLLKKKNPYLYRAKNMNTPQDIVESISSAFISSAEETMFGDWLEQLAIFVGSKAYGAYKSAAEGIDMELDRDGVHYAVAIKSGPNWANADSRKKLYENFRKARRAYATGGNKRLFECIEGCCYGKSKGRPDAEFIKLCGASFWEFISGSPSLYVDIIKPLGTNARIHNDAYIVEYNKMLTRFTREFANKYSLSDGAIDWEKILVLNSGK